MAGQFGHQALTPFLKGGRAALGDAALTLIPVANALRAARAVARNDGLFLFELDLDESGGLNLSDIDELAHVVARIFKQGLLQHTPFQRALPDSGSIRRLKPDEILLVYPVRLLPGPWSACIDEALLTPERVRAATTAGGHAAQQAQQALAVLRQRYLQLEDAIGFRIAVHRRRQSENNTLTRILAALLYASLASGVILLPAARFIEGVDPWAAPGLALTVVGLAVALHFRQRIAVWDAPVIHLLRTAHGFFVSSNVLNSVVEAADLDGQGRRVDDFDNVARNLESRLEGEQLRVSLGQGWLALAVAGASLMAALAAFQGAPG